MVEFRKAEKKKSKLRLGISAPSGGGKTYSALLIAYGITKNWSKIAVIDTERGSAELYSDLGEYCVAQLTPPFTPQKYIDCIHSAEQAGFEVIIVDSLSHAWTGEGGMLEMQDAIARASKSGNSYTAWREVTPLHNKLVDTILQSRAHIIVTTRSKTEYVMQTENGKTVPKKVGLSPVFRDGLEYEMTVFFDLSVEHIAQATKDRTSLFDGVYFKPSIETGEKLVKWLDNGVDPDKQTISKQSDKLICPVCGKQVAPVKCKDGTILPAQKILDTYHKCANCIASENKAKKQAQANTQADTKQIENDTKNDITNDAEQIPSEA